MFGSYIKYICMRVIEIVGVIGIMNEMLKVKCLIKFIHISIESKRSKNRVKPTEKNNNSGSSFTNRMKTYTFDKMIAENFYWRIKENAKRMMMEWIVRKTRWIAKDEWICSPLCHFQLLFVAFSLPQFQCYRTRSQFAVQSSYSSSILYLCANIRFSTFPYWTSKCSVFWNQMLT